VLRNGAPVSGSVVLTADGLRAEFRPAQPLARIRIMSCHSQDIVI